MQYSFITEGYFLNSIHLRLRMKKKSSEKRRFCFIYCCIRNHSNKVCDLKQVIYFPQKTTDLVGLNRDTSLPHMALEWLN